MKVVQRLSLISSGQQLLEIQCGSCRRPTLNNNNNNNETRLAYFLVESEIEGRNQELNDLLPICY